MLGAGLVPLNVSATKTSNKAGRRRVEPQLDMQTGMAGRQQAINMLI